MFPDPSSAPARELMLLPRVGPVRAEAIIANRTRDGPFRSLADLQRVRGIGPVTVAGIRRVSAAAFRPLLALGQLVQQGNGVKESLPVPLREFARETPLSVPQHGIQLGSESESAPGGSPQSRTSIVRVGPPAHDPAAGQLANQSAHRGLLESSALGEVGHALFTVLEQACEQVCVGLRDAETLKGPVEQPIHPAVCGAEPEPDEAAKRIFHGAGILRGPEGRAD